MTQVSWKRQLFLAIALVLAGSAVYWYQFSHRPKKETEEEQAKKAFPLKDVVIASVRLGEGAKAFAFECLDLKTPLCKPGDNSKWQMKEPTAMRGDDANVNALLSALNNLMTSETIDLSTETPDKRAALLKEYKLDAASRGAGAKHVEVKGNDGKNWSLVVGDVHPLGDSFFSLMGKASDGTPDETKVYLIPTYFKSNFDHDLNYWRDKKLMSLASHQIQGFDLQAPKGAVAGTRQDSQWTLKSGAEEVPGDYENIDSFLSSATFLTAKQVVVESKTDVKAKSVLKGANQVLTLMLTASADVPAPTTAATPQPSSTPTVGGATRAITLVLWEKKAGGKADAKPAGPTLYATISSQEPLYEIDFATKAKLDKNLKDLRLVKLVTSMERFTAKRIDFEGPALGAGPLSISTPDSKWSIIDSTTGKILPNAAAVSDEKVQDLLDKLSGNRIHDFITDPKILAGAAGGLKVSLGDEKKPNQKRLLFWKQGNSYYAQDLNSKRKEAFSIDGAIESVLPTSRTFFEKSAPTTAATPPATAGALPPGHPMSMPPGHPRATAPGKEPAHLNH